MIVIVNNAERYINLGSAAKTPMAIALDVLDEYVTFTVTGECNGKYLVATDGTVINNVDVKAYDVVFDEIGMYTFTFVATDRMGNTNRGYATLNVVDSVAPTITVSSKTLTGKVGSGVKIPQATAVDNGKSVDVYVVVERPDLVWEGVSKGQYVPTMKGTHTIYYICVDESGNVARVTVKLEVK